MRRDLGASSEECCAVSIRAETLPVDSHFGLIGHCRRRGFDGVEIAEAPIERRKSLPRAQRGIEVVDEGHAGRDVERGDLAVADVVEMLDQGSQAVAVRGDEYDLAVDEVGG